MKANVHGLAFLAFGNAFVLIFSNSFCALSREGMGDRKEANQIVAEHNGQVFRFNEVVHIFEGTAAGVPGKKTEFTKAWFKGVDKTKAEERFICRPVVGHSGGPFPRFSKGAVFKVKVDTHSEPKPLPNPKPYLDPNTACAHLKVFGVGVLEEHGRSNRWDRLKPASKER